MDPVKFYGNGRSVCYQTGHTVVVLGSGPEAAKNSQRLREDPQLLERLLSGAGKPKEDKAESSESE